MEFMIFYLVTPLTVNNGFSSFIFRSGATAKFTTNMAVQFGLLQIICRNNLNAFTMHGLSNFGIGILDGRTPRLVPGSSLVVSAMVNVKQKMIS